MAWDSALKYFLLKKHDLPLNSCSTQQHMKQCICQAYATANVTYFHSASVKACAEAKTHGAAAMAAAGVRSRTDAGT